MSGAGGGVIGFAVASALLLLLENLGRGPLAGDWAPKWVSSHIIRASQQNLGALFPGTACHDGYPVIWPCRKFGSHKLVMVRGRNETRAWESTRSRATRWRDPWPTAAGRSWVGHVSRPAMKHINAHAIWQLCGDVQPLTTMEAAGSPVVGWGFRPAADKPRH